MVSTEPTKSLELNTKYGFAKENTQQHFDEDGKLPRYENDDQAKCYGCDDFEKVRNGIFESDLNPYTNEDSSTTKTNESISLVSIKDKFESQTSILQSDTEIGKQSKITELEQEIQTSW